MFNKKFLQQFCTYNFKAETNKLLQIVAKSLYTDSDVFLRELVSNSSDALEKRRLFDQEVDNQKLQIQIFSNDKDNEIIIQDSGIGMTKDDLVNNLGIIAKSGSEELKNQGEIDVEKIIGQFGVGFYSSFIVGNRIKVISKKYDQEQAFIWQSDGISNFTVDPYTEEFPSAGTKIIIQLKEDFKKYSEKSSIQKIIEKHSNFISYPILINNEKLNLIPAIWAMQKQDVSDEDYQRFYEYITSTKSQYQYKLHVEIDVPLSVQALLYIPRTHNEQMGVSQEESKLGFYSRKVLIKDKCKELLPNYLRFIKGVVDSADVSLNISRENYQNSHIITQLNKILTKRVIRFLKQMQNNDRELFNSWYQNFNMFIKEGLATDNDNQQDLMKLCLFESRKEKSITIDEYCQKMQPGQNKIYYLLSNNREGSEKNSLMESFQNTELDVIYSYVHIDEMVFRNMGNYNNFKFVNIESDNEELKDLNQFIKNKPDQKQFVPQSELTEFCLWIKTELQPLVNKVEVSNRLNQSPVLIQSPMSTAMRQMMMLMDKNNANQQQMQNLTLEININNEVIGYLNKLRLTNSQLASMIIKQLADNSMIQQNLLNDSKNFVGRIQSMIEILIKKEGIEIDSVNEVNDEKQKDEKIEEIKV